MTKAYYMSTHYDKSFRIIYIEYTLMTKALYILSTHNNGKHNIYSEYT